MQMGQRQEFEFVAANHCRPNFDFKEIFFYLLVLLGALLALFILKRTCSWLFLHRGDHFENAFELPILGQDILQCHSLDVLGLFFVNLVILYSVGHQLITVRLGTLFENQTLQQFGVLLLRFGKVLSMIHSDFFGVKHTPLINSCILN
jgi:hypothetical protein